MNLSLRAALVEVEDLLQEHVAEFLAVGHFKPLRV